MCLLVCCFFASWESAPTRPPGSLVLNSVLMVFELCWLIVDVVKCGNSVIKGGLVIWVGGTRLSPGGGSLSPMDGAHPDDHPP